MKPHKKIESLFILTISILIGSLSPISLSGQCPGGESCEDAYLFCTLSEMNGFVCNNNFMGSHQCSPLCTGISPNGMGPFTWWAFQNPGGKISITLTWGVCADTDGDGDKDAVAWGIYSSCPCGDEIFCSNYGHPIPNGQTFQGNLNPCKIYYMVG